VRGSLTPPADGPAGAAQVKWFNVQKGFGFVTPDDGSEEIFVHQTAIHAEGFRSLKEVRCRRGCSLTASTQLAAARRGATHGSAACERRAGAAACWRGARHASSGTVRRATGSLCDAAPPLAGRAWWAARPGATKAGPMLAPRRCTARNRPHSAAGGAGHFSNRLR
jgi:hypothetical protein